MVWVKLDDRFDEHPKMASVGPLGVALWVTGLAYCNRNLTDGFIPRSVARTLIDWTHADGDGVEWAIAVTRIGDDDVAGSGMDIASEDIIGSLLDAGIWERVRGGFLVHDFGDYQPTKAEIEELTRQKQAAGRAGGLATATARGRANGRAPARARAKAESKPEPEPEPEPVPVPESESEPMMTTSSSTNLTDDLSHYDLADPTDVWAMYSNGRELTEKQQMLVAAWILSEGRDEVVELMKRAWRMQATGRPGFDPFGYVKGVVQDRRDAKIDAVKVDDRRRREAVIEERAAHDEVVAKADPEEHRRSLLRGRIIRLKMDNPALPDVPVDKDDIPALEAWLAANDERENA